MVMTVVRLELLPSQKTGEHVVTCQDPTLDGVVIDATRAMLCIGPAVADD
jgi:hypothetical protein